MYRHAHVGVVDCVYADLMVRCWFARLVFCLRVVVCVACFCVALPRGGSFCICVIDCVVLFGGACCFVCVALCVC